MQVWRDIRGYLSRGEACVLVSVVAAAGSVPREEGAHMVVSADDFNGTIGGGALEWQALGDARRLLQEKGNCRWLTLALGPTLGQCCGGQVGLFFEVYTPERLAEAEGLVAREKLRPFTLSRRFEGRDFVLNFGKKRRRIYLFGAGHVGRALVLALAALDFDLWWVDQRPELFPSLLPGTVVMLSPAEPASLLAEAPPDSLVLIMTHSHALDFLLVDASLRSLSCAVVGLIGSASKRQRFVTQLKAAGIKGEELAKLRCPIGVEGISSKEPAAIAIATAAQICQEDERLAKMGY